MNKNANLTQRETEKKAFLIISCIPRKELCSISKIILQKHGKHAPDFLWNLKDKTIFFLLKVKLFDLTVAWHDSTITESLWLYHLYKILHFNHNKISLIFKIHFQIIYGTLKRYSFPFLDDYESDEWMTCSYHQVMKIKIQLWACLQ